MRRHGAGRWLHSGINLLVIVALILGLLPWAPPASAATIAGPSLTPARAISQEPAVASSLSSPASSTQRSISAAIGPIISSTSPVGASAPIDSQIRITFDRAIEVSSFAGTINGSPIVPTQIVPDATNTVVTVDPGELEYARTYDVVISATVKDTLGNALGQDSAFSFRTADNANPKRPTTTVSLPTGQPQVGQSYTISGQASGYVWQRDSGNPLALTHYSADGTASGDSPMLHPAIEYFPEGVDGYKYWLFYTPYPPAEDENPTLMRSNDGVHFEAAGVTRNPLFTYNTQPPFDSMNLADPEAYRLGSTWMLFYEMETPGQTAEAIGSWMTGGGYIGVAFSADNGRTWQPYGGPYTYNPANPPTGFPANGNPVIYPDLTVPWEANGGAKTGEMAVFFKDGKYHLYRTVLGPTLNIAYDTATDPRGPWQKQGKAVEFGGYYYGPHPDVVYDAERGVYLMLFLTPDGADYGQLGIYSATSPAGPWTAHPLNPIFRAAGGWEGERLYRASLAKVDGRWSMYYSGNASGSPQIGLAREVPGARRVEVSTNGGQSWLPATVGASGAWSFNWTPPADGTYTIQARVTDDFLQGAPTSGASVTVGQGQPSTTGKPILVVTDSAYGANPFGKYLTEILKAEGLVEFQQIERSALMSESNPQAYVSGYRTVLLAEMSLSAAEEGIFRQYVSSGGTLVAMRPDRDLADLFGLTHVGTRPEQLLQFFAVDTASRPGAGIVGVSLQYHGEADNYTLNGATALAALWNNISTPSANPAVARNSSGQGQAIAFTFDLAKSIVLTRQGNPAWKDSEGDGLGNYRPGDLFFRTNGDKWLAPERTRIPQADEAQRFLANIVLTSTTAPLPRMWYLPDRQRALFISTGDGEDYSGSQLAPTVNAAASYGAGFTSYLSENGIANTPPAMEAAWRAAGHEFGPHVYADRNYQALNAAYQSIVGSLQTAFGHGARTARNHTIAWTGWVDMAAIEAEYGTGLDTNYYHYLPPLLSYGENANGYFTGSGLPQRFMKEDGTILPIYQALTEWPDEWFADNGYTAAQTTQVIESMLQSADNGYYSAFVANVHHVRYDGVDSITRTWANQVWAYARDHGIPMWSAEKLLDFVQARDASSFSNLNWNGTTLAFDFQTPAAGQHLTMMVPSRVGSSNLVSVTLDGNPVSYTTDTIKGQGFALFTTTAASNHVVANYGADTTSPAISNVRATSAADTTAVIGWDTDESADSQVEYGTTTAYGTKTPVATALVTGHSQQLTGLQPNTLYHYRVLSGDSAGNKSTSADFTFRTSLPLWVETSAADFGDGTASGVRTVPDGSLILGTATGFDDDFAGSALDAGKWITGNFFGSAPSVTVANSAVTLTGGTYIRTSQSWFQKTLEGRVTLSDGPNAHFGFATALDAVAEGVPDPHWAIFSVQNGQFVARTRLNDGQGANGEVNTILAGVAPGVAHDLKIVWKADNTFEFWVDGTLKTTHNRAFTESMRVVLSSNGGQSGSADRTIVSGAYATSGTYESSTFDSGGTGQYRTLTWTGNAPVGTAVSFETATSVGGSTWSPWAAVGAAGAIASPSGRYLKYRATLSTANPDSTPQVDDVTVSYENGLDTAPPQLGATDPVDGATGVAVDRDITLTYDEPIEPASLHATLSGGTALSASLSNGNRTVTLHPASSLAYDTGYTVTVAAGVRDVLGNATPAAYVLSFKTAIRTMAWNETTTADFSDGALNNTMVQSGSGDGEIVLGSADFTDSFAQANGPANNWETWPSSYQQLGTPTWGVVGNVYVHDLNAAVISYHPAVLKSAYTPTGDFSLRVRERTVQGDGSSALLGLVFGATDAQHYYFVQLYGGILKLYEYTAPGTYRLVTEAAVPGPTIGTWYSLRLDVSGTTLNLYVDDTLRLTWTEPGYRPGRIGLLGYGGSQNEYDDVVVSGQMLAPSGTYVSSPLTTGAPVTINRLTSQSLTPAGTGVSFEVRAADTEATLAGAEWVAVAGDGSISGVRGTFAQYRATLTTSSVTQTPTIQQVGVFYAELPADTTPPTVVSTTPTGTNEPIGTNLVITFSELIATSTFAATINGAAVAPTEIQFGQSGGRAVVTIDPKANLTNSTLYTIVIPATVTDLAGNPLGGEHRWQFTTANPTLAWTQTTAADFAGCGATSNVAVTRDGDGEIRLQPTIYEHFDAATLPATWTSSSWGGNPYAPGITGSVLTHTNPVDGAYTKTADKYSPERVLEGRLKFSRGANSTAPYLYFGFAGDGLVPWLLFGTGYTGDQVYTSVYNGRPGDPVTFPLGDLFDQWHDYKIVWKVDSVDFWVDGTLRRTESLTVSGPLNVYFSAGGGAPAGSSVVAELVRLGSYTSSPGSYTSCAIDLGKPVHWLTYSSTVATPSGTGITFETRSGNTPDPSDGTWSAWAPLGSGGSIASPNGRYLQYRAALSTTDPYQSPSLEAVSISYEVPTNRPPVAADDAYSLSQDASLTVPAAQGVLKNDSDPDGNPIVAIKASEPTHGTLTLSDDGSFVYAPKAGYSGADAFTYKVNDGGLDSNVATVTITIEPVNEPPVAQAQTVKATQDEAMSILLAATDPNSDALTFTVVAPPAHGSLTGTAPSLLYTPAAGYSGPDSFTFKANDGTVDSEPATVSITVEPVNASPVAVDDSATTGEGVPIKIAVLANDSDPDKDALAVTSITQPAHGTATIEADGSVTYAPTAGYSGPDSFTYTISDPGGKTATATVTLTVAAKNDPPSFTKGPDQSVPEDAPAQTIAGWATAISAGPADEIDQALQFELTSDNPNLFAAAPTIDAKTGTLTFTPAPNANGVANLTITLKDDGGTASGGRDTSDPQTLKIEVVAVNDAPSFKKGVDVSVAEDAGAQTIAGWAKEIAAGPANESSQALTFTVSNDKPDLFSAQPSIAPNGTLTFTSAPNANGAATVTITLKDDGGTANGGVDATPPQTFAIAVTPVNDAPEVKSDPATQTVQYSDPIKPVTIGASDVDSPATALQAKATGLPGGITLRETATSGNTRTWVLEGRALDVAKSYDVVVSVTDGQASKDATVRIVVAAEEAVAIFHASNPVAVQVAQPGGASGSFSLTLRIKEAQPDGPSGAQPGDIARAALQELKLAPVGPGSSVSGSCAAEGVSGAGYDAFRSYRCSFSGVSVNTYAVVAVVGGGYYTGSSEDVLTVYDPSLGYTSGAGKFAWAGTGELTSFGFTMSYNKSGKNVQGKLLVVRHAADGRSYRLKSNSLDGLVITPATKGKPGWATFGGKATYLEPGWSDAKGNYGFTVYVEDGSPDRFWLEVKDPSGKTVDGLSIPREAVTNAIGLSDGSVTVPVAR